MPSAERPPPEEHRKTPSENVVTAATITFVTEPDNQWWSGSVQAPPPPQASVPPPHLPDRPLDWPPQEQPRQSWIKRRFGPVLAAIAAFFAKIKAILVLLPKVKLFTTVGTMAVSLAAYGWIWSIPFAAGFVLLLFVHEMGHVIALRREGIKASAPMFVPFLGAVVAAKSLGDNATAEARVGLAGRSSAPSAPPCASSSGTPPVLEAATGPGPGGPRRRRRRDPRRADRRIWSPTGRGRGSAPAPSAPATPSVVAFVDAEHGRRRRPFEVLTVVDHGDIPPVLRLPAGIARRRRRRWPPSARPARCR